MYEYLLPQFREDTGIEVRVIAVGTGRALNIGRRGDADLVIVHDEDLELAFVKEGYGVGRRPLMYNEYILIGPRADPAGAGGAASIVGAFDVIARAQARFVSRGDDSGTHKQERALWRRAATGTPDAKWYIESGNGMGATLQMAKELGGYTLSDKATWLSFGNKRGLALILGDRPPLKNIYSIILVNPQRHPEVRHAEARKLSDWLLSGRGRRMIADFRLDGRPLFFTGP